MINNKKTGRLRPVFLLEKVLVYNFFEICAYIKSLAVDRCTHINTIVEIRS